MTVYRYRANYWANSKFAEFIRGIAGSNKKPKAATLEEWYKWEKDYKNNFPISYLITEKVLHKAQNFVYYPADLYNHFKFKFINRFINKTHYLQTGLKKGEYYEINVRMLYGMFYTLELYVEKELQSMADSWEIGTGYEYLIWETELKDSNGEESFQAKTAKEVLALYKWWKARKILDIYSGDDDTDTDTDTEMLIRLVKIRDSLWT